MSNWIDICGLGDITPLGARVVDRGDMVAVAIFRTAEDKVFALLDKCPHKGGPLSQGMVFGDTVACPLHNWQIGLAHGCAQAPDTGCTPRFDVKQENGRVYLDVEQLHTLAQEPKVKVVPHPITRPILLQVAS